jgi:hypothetical protein
MDTAPEPIRQVHTLPATAPANADPAELAKFSALAHR